MWKKNQDGNRRPEPEEDPFRRERFRMVEKQLRDRGIRDPRVLAVMEALPRHLFVASADRASAYADSPLPIGFGQTISQPYIVALMTEALELVPEQRVLEIGTGSGYQTAVLARLAREVFSIESVSALADEAQRRLGDLGIRNVQIRVGDGYRGWPEEAPFDCVIATAAPETVPDSLVAQLADGGRMVIPIGVQYQELIVLHKNGEKVARKKIADVRFVPMVKRSK
jgi:protein-L-isoaspartate(D-aspartate) O-methyltransferase